jgi:phosphoglucosamine mutase
VRDRTRNRHVPGAVGTLMSNFGLEQAFQRLGVAFERAKVGDRYVLETLQQRGWLYGGESSGHLLCLDCHTTGDGTISALQVLGAIRRSGMTLAALTQELVLYPQRLINVRVHKDFDWQRHDGLAAARTQVERELGQDGRVLIRPSGTEPLLRVMVEARSDDAAGRLAQQLADAVSA